MVMTKLGTLIDIFRFPKRKSQFLMLIKRSLLSTFQLYIQKLNHIRLDVSLSLPKELLLSFYPPSRVSFFYLVLSFS